jgi:sensor domain CHASE-containing protein
VAGLGQSRPVRDPVRAVSLAEEFAGARRQPLTNGFKVFRLDWTAESQQLCAATLPVAHHALTFGIVVTLGQVARGIAFAV